MGPITATCVHACDYCEQAEQRRRQDLISGQGLFAPLSFRSHYFPYFSLIRSEVAPSMQLEGQGHYSDIWSGAYDDMSPGRKRVSWVLFCWRKRDLEVSESMLCVD